MNKLIKDKSSSFPGDYRVIDSNGNAIALICKISSGKGYKKFIKSDVTGKWFNPQYFSWFATLRDVKRYYNII